MYMYLNFRRHRQHFAGFFHAISLCLSKLETLKVLINYYYNICFLNVHTEIFFLGEL